MKNDSKTLNVDSPEEHHAGGYTVRGIHIPTRYFLAPINTGFFADGLPTEGLRRFHHDRSGRSIGISVVGNVAIGPEYTNSPTTAFLADKRAWGAIAETISSNGSVPGIQLACKTLAEAAPRKWVNDNVSTFVDRMRSHIISLSTETLDKILDGFVHATHLAWRLGFRVVQFHAAHGYLLALLLSQEINHRKDRYADGVEVIRRLTTAARGLGIGVILDVRVSLSDGIRNRNEELESCEQRVARLAAMDLDIISLSDGFYDLNRYSIYPRPEDGPGCYVDLAAAYATKFKGKIWNVAGNVWDIAAMTPKLPPNLSLSIGRSLIADPTFIEKSIAGTHPLINQCIRAGHCHYYTRGKDNIACKVNTSVAGDESYHLPIVSIEPPHNS